VLQMHAEALRRGGGASGSGKSTLRYTGDEPTGALDSNSAAEVCGWLLERERSREPAAPTAA
jgi:hypothetical protein